MQDATFGTIHETKHDGIDGVMVDATLGTPFLAIFDSMESLKVARFGATFDATFPFVFVSTRGLKVAGTVTVGLKGATGLGTVFEEMSVNCMFDGVACGLKLLAV